MAEQERIDKVKVRVPKKMRSALTAAQIIALKRTFKASLVETITKGRRPPQIVIEIEPIFRKPPKKA